MAQGGRITERRAMPTLTSLFKVSCPTCAHGTPTTLDWLSEHGVICEGCFQSIAVNATELGRGLAAINLAWDEVDSVARDLRRPMSQLQLSPRLADLGLQRS